MTRRRRWVVLVALAGLASAPPARAFDDGAATFESGARLYHKELPRLEDIPVPHVEVERPPEQAPPKESGPKFEIRSFEVRGNTLLAPSQIDAALAQFEGKDKSIDDVQASRDALQNLYSREGFITVAVTIPQQTVAEGTIRLQVIEARLGKVEIENPGVHWYSDDDVAERTPHLRPGAILRREDVTSDLIRANTSPDLQVRPVMKPGSEPETVDLTLSVEDRIPLHATVEIDNDRPPGSPDTRAQAQVSYLNLWDLGHEGSFFYQTAVSSSPEDVKIYGGTYRAPMPWSDRQSLFYYIVKSDTTSEVVGAAGISLFGKGLNMGLRYQVALPDLPEVPWFHHSVSLGIDRKDVENDLTEQPQPGEPPPDTIVTPITYLPLSLAYSMSVDTSQSQTYLQTGLYAIQSGWVSGGSRKDFQANRGGDVPGNPVDGNLEIVRLNFNQLVRVPALLQTLAAGRFIALPEPVSSSFGDDWTLQLTARGQWASEPLISTEQYAAGGLDSVRGYFQSKRFGDNAVNTQLELRTPFWTPDWSGRPLPTRFQLIGYFDAAQLYTNHPGEGQNSVYDLQGIGVGLQASLFDRVTARLYASDPLIDSSQDPRFNFEVSAGF
ncbi:MAG TPA: POTRA domain-containing protein [Myxococcota bacterium]|nr:POTRA domain-containing protein [Myxococcota bacterium]